MVKTKNYNSIIWVIAVLAGLLVLSLIEFNVSLPESERQIAMVRIDFGDGRQRTFNGTAVSGMTLMDSLDASIVAGDLSVTYTADADSNVLISAIGDKANSIDGIWRFYLNQSEIAGKDLVKTSVHGGDMVEVKFLLWPE